MLTVNQKPKTILIVEDDNYLRASLRDKLSKSYNIMEAADGVEAVIKFNEQAPDLILLDLLLPKLDGFGVLGQLRKNPDKKISETKVVVFSNLWSDKDILQAKALKVEEYFVKSHSKIEDVLGKIYQILKD